MENHNETIEGLERVPAWLGENLRRERTNHGWTLADVAGRMTRLGAPMTLNTVSKVEGAKGRSVSTTELVAFSRCFGLSIERLLADPALGVETELFELLDRWLELRDQRDLLVEKARFVRADARHLVERIPAAREAMSRFWIDRGVAIEEDADPDELSEWFLTGQGS